MAHLCLVGVCVQAFNRHGDGRRAAHRHPRGQAGESINTLASREHIVDTLSNTDRTKAFYEVECHRTLTI